MEAQFSPIRDILVEDFDKDGIPDLLLAGNNYSTRPSLGRQDTSYGWLILGNRDLNFECLWPAKSGILFPGDTRKMHLIEIEDEAYLVQLPNKGNFQVFKVGR